MKRMVISVVALVVVALFPAAVFAQWADNFDSYANGSGLIGQGGWVGWDNNPGANAFVTNLRSRSAPNSASIISTSDIVQRFSGVSAGAWRITGYCFIPETGTGSQFFILLNTYNHGGPYNWSLDLEFDQDAGLVRDFDDPSTPTVPLIRKQWVQVSVVIDFVGNSQQVFYNGALFTAKSWTEGASGGGVLNLAALDLYSQSASTIYWDDLSLQREGATPVAPATWGGIKAAFKR